MAILIKEVTAFVCERCEHEWIPRKQPEEMGKPSVSERPTVCPKCKSPYWNRPRKDEKNKKTVEEKAPCAMTDEEIGIYIGEGID